MRVLFDTNVLIAREDDKILNEQLAELLSSLSERKIPVLIHPRSQQDINRDQNQHRREVTLSKLKAYPSLENSVQFEEDNDFCSIAGQVNRPQDSIDLALLHAVYKNAVTFLITEDNGLHTKARRLKLEDRVLTVDQALASFKKTVPSPLPEILALEETPVHQLNLTDPIFNSLRMGYDEFDEWWKKICQEGRRAWIFRRRHGGNLGGLMILKEEKEPYDCTTPMPAKQRIKICTFIITDTGKKMGELFLKVVFHKAAKTNVEEVYLTHFMQSEDHLVPLITDFGFERIGSNTRGEDVFIKRSRPNEPAPADPLDFARTFYPYCIDGEMVGKFIVPIRPIYHNRLFPEYPGSLPPLLARMGIPTPVEGNTIRKAYFSSFRTKKLKKGDLLFFYRSHDIKGITCMGVAENIYYNLNDSDQMMALATKRTVYTKDELEIMAKKGPVALLLFSFHCYLSQCLKLEELVYSNVLKGAPQSITELPHTQYLAMKAIGGLDGCFTVDTSPIC